jgi:Uma2 family endonuclease
MPTVSTLMTAEEFADLTDNRRTELVRGEVVSMSPVGKVHGRIVVRLSGRMDVFVQEHHLGWCGTETGFILDRDPDVVRAPDLAFVSAARLRDLDADGYFELAPDLAVEVLSPGDRASDLNVKVEEYFRAGVKLVWVLDPKVEKVWVHRPGSPIRVFSGDDEVSGEDVLPGFTFRPRDVFAQ